MGDPPALRNLQTGGRRTEVQGRGDYERCDHKVTVRGYTNCGNEIPPEDTQLSYEETHQACEVMIQFPFNNTNRRTNFPNLFLSRNSVCFRQFLCPSSGVFHSTFGGGICHAGLMTTFKHDHPGRVWKLSSRSVPAIKLNEICQYLPMYKEVA
jgi:hypothetical protein